MPYCQFSIYHGPPPPPLPRIPIFPATLAQLSQSSGMSGTDVTVAMLHNVTIVSFCHRDHFAMLHCSNDNVSAQCDNG